jgi:hypothetical protein
MHDPWFSPMWSFLPGTLLGVCVGFLGAMVGILAPRGKAKPMVMGFYFGMLILSVILLLVGLVAICVGQPYHVWYALLLGGLIGSLVLGCNFWTIKNVYAQAEHRKMQAREL